MRSRALRNAAAIVITLCGQALVAPSASAAPPPFVTILFSRSQWAIHESCSVLRGAITLDRVAADLHNRGGVGTGSVVTSRVLESSMRCTHNAVYPSWEILERLHADYGWESTSHSATYPNMTLLGRSEQFAESCDTLPTFVNHGFFRAWGLFSYPNDQRSTDIQSNVVSSCFAYGRRYGRSPNAFATMAAPWWANVRSVNGGKCNDPAAACYSISTKYRYQSPFSVADLVDVSAGQWAVPQFHKLVSGSRLAGTVRWDCTASDWRLHFTNETELYCWNDYQRVLNAIPDAAVVTDPATVARAWGSNPAVLGLHR